MKKEDDEVSDQVEIREDFTVNDFSVMITPEGYKVLPPMIYKAELIDITIDDGKCHEGKNFVPLFKVIMPEQKGISEELKLDLIGRETKGLIEIALAHSHLKKAPRKSLLWQMIRALSDKNFKDIDYSEINLKDLIGRTCYIKVEKKIEHNKTYINKITKYFNVNDIEGEGC